MHTPRGRRPAPGSPARLIRPEARDGSGYRRPFPAPGGPRAAEVAPVLRCLAWHGRVPAVDSTCPGRCSPRLVIIGFWTRCVMPAAQVPGFDVGQGAAVRVEKMVAFYT